MAKLVLFEGDSLSVLRNFPTNVRVDLGYALRQLQNGEVPECSRPMTSISPGVFELKAQDEAGWYRSIYTTKIKDRVFVLHCFAKKSRKTSGHDLEVATKRLKILIAREKK